MPNYGKLADEMGWLCAECGKLPCECPIGEDDIDLKLVMDCPTHTIAFKIRDSETEVIVPFNEEDAHELAVAIAKILLHFHIAHEPNTHTHNYPFN